MKLAPFCQGPLLDPRSALQDRLVSPKVDIRRRRQHYRIEGIILYPKPVQKPYPPIWMGGGVQSIWRAARYSEYLLCFWPNEEEVRTAA